MFSPACSPPSTSSLPAIAVDTVRELVFVHGGIHSGNGSVERRLFIFDLSTRQWIDQDEEDRRISKMNGKMESGASSSQDDIISKRIAPYSPSLESLVRSAQRCMMTSSSSSSTSGVEDDRVKLKLALESLRRAMIGNTSNNNDELTTSQHSSTSSIKSEGRNGTAPVVGVKRERDIDHGGEGGVTNNKIMALRRVASVVSPSTAPSRFGHVAWVFNRSTLLIHGGADSNTNRKAGGSGDVFAFHTKSGIWERLSRQIGGCEAPAMFGHSLLPLHTHIQFSHARRRERELARRARRKERLAASTPQPQPPVVRGSDDDSDDDSGRNDESSEDDDDDSESEGMDWLPLSQRGIFCMIGSVDIRQIRRATASNRSSSSSSSRPQSCPHSHIVSLYVLCLSSVVGTRWVHVDTNLTAAALGSNKKSNTAEGDSTSAIMKFPHRQHFIISPADPRAASGGGGRGTLTGGSVGQGGAGGGHQSSAGGHTEEEALLLGGTLSMVDFFLLGGETPQGTALHDLYFFNASVGVWRSVCVFAAEGAVGERLPSPLSCVSLRPWNTATTPSSVINPSFHHLSHNCPFAIHLVPKNYQRDDEHAEAAAGGTLGFLLVGEKKGVLVVDLGATRQSAPNHLDVSGTVVDLSSAKKRIHKKPERITSRITGSAYTKLSSISDGNLKPQMNVEVCGFMMTSSELMSPCTLSVRYSLEQHVAGSGREVTAPMLAALMDNTHNPNPSPLQSEGAPSETDSLLDALLNDDDDAEETAGAVPDEVPVPEKLMEEVTTEATPAPELDDDLLDDLMKSASDEVDLLDELLASESE